MKAIEIRGVFVEIRLIHYHMGVDFDLIFLSKTEDIYMNR